MESITEISNPEHEYIIARWMYSIGEPIMEESTYLAIHKTFQEMEILPEYTSRSWSSDPCPDELLDLYGMTEHKYQITLTDKTESMDTIDSWEDLEQQFLHSPYPKVLSYKVDGFNVQEHVYNKVPVSLQTRGRKNDAIDISNYLPHVPQILDFDGEIRVVGEMALSYPAFEQLKRMFPDKQLKSIRSSVRSALSEESAHHLLTFIPFKVTGESLPEMNVMDMYFELHMAEFVIPKPREIYNYDEMVKAIKEMQDELDKFPYPTDGLVVSEMDGEFNTAVRVEAWKDPVYYSLIETYDETKGPSRTGVKLKIKPVQLENSTQTLVNITNYRRVMNLGLYPGTPVAFKLTSKAIADLDWTATKMLQKLHQTNPEVTERMIGKRNKW